MVTQEGVESGTAYSISIIIKIHTGTDSLYNKQKLRKKDG